MALLQADAADVTISQFLFAWDLTGPMTALVGLSVVLYLAGLWRLLRRGGTRAVPIKKVVYAMSGLALLAVSLIGPLDAYAGRAFFIHMSQHLLLAMFAAPLLLAAAPVAAYMWALPEDLRLGVGAGLARQGVLRRAVLIVTTPWVALTVFIGCFYVWHHPAAYGAALNNGWVHFAEHLTMFLSGVLFWWPLISPAPVRSPLSYPQRLIYLLAAVTPKALLAAIITLSGHVLYSDYLTAPDMWNIPDDQDQVISGLLMWIPGNLVFLSALTVLFFKWYESEEGSLSGDPAAAARKRRKQMKEP